jgi:NADH-quinone oxidoreductase subunit N
MTFSSLVALLPFILIALTLLINLAIIILRRHHRRIALTSVVGLVLALASLPVSATIVASMPSPQITRLLVIDDYTVYFVGVILLAAIAITILSSVYLNNREGETEEFYLLLLLATLGASFLVASDHFASFFLALEILSISLYALIAYPPKRQGSLEAGVKYLVLAAFSTTFLLFGMALIYEELGTMGFSDISALLKASGNKPDVILLAGIGLLIIGFGFKLALVPFHMWTGDVYQGAPAPVTAFIATISKGSIFVVLLRFFSRQGFYTDYSLYLALALIAIASMLVGNWLALLQKHIKRLLAYSSIAHMGYLLVPLLAGGAMADMALIFYLTAYFVTMLGAFGVISLLSDDAQDADDLESYRGLFWRHPWLAGVFTAMLLSLAGIPLTAGFIGKFYLVAAGVGSSSWTLVIVLVLSSVIGLFYYLRVVVVMFSNIPARAGAPADGPRLPIAGSLTLAALTILLLWLGVYPNPVTHLIQDIITRLS